MQRQGWRLDRLWGTPVWPELVTLDYAIRGKFMHYLFQPSLGKIRSFKFSDSELKAQMREGRLTILFDENGEFIKDSNAASPKDFG
jgi:hypothetical protein